MQTCGKPDMQKDSVKKNENIPQEWLYFISQSVYLGGSQQTAQGTLKTTVTFDDKGKAINISTNGLGVGQTSICSGGSIQLGDTRDTVKNACGNPVDVKKLNAPGSAAPQDIKVMEFTYTSVTPNVTLVFENGVLTDKK